MHVSDGQNSLPSGQPPCRWRHAEENPWRHHSLEPRVVGGLSSPSVDTATVLTPFISGHLASANRTTSLTWPRYAGIDLVLNLARLITNFVMYSVNHRKWKTSQNLTGFRQCNVSPEFTEFTLPVQNWHQSLTHILNDSSRKFLWHHVCYGSGIFAACS